MPTLVRIGAIAWAGLIVVGVGISVWIVWTARAEDLAEFGPTRRPPNTYGPTYWETYGSELRALWETVREYGGILAFEARVLWRMCRGRD